MKRRINRRNGVGILMAAVVAAGSLQVPALAQVEAAESVPVVETTTLEDGNLGAASSQGAQLNFSNIGATYNVKDYGASTSLDDNYPAFQAALDAAKNVCELPVMCTLSLESDGTARFGGSAEEIEATLEAMGASAVGIN